MKNSAGQKYRILVTGAAGGIGSAIVFALRQRGAEVIGSDVCPVPNDTAPDGWVTSDLMTQHGREHLVATLQGQRQLDGLVHTAAVIDSEEWDSIDEEEANKILSLNVLTPYFLTRALLPILARPASIVLLGSVAALRASPKTAVYAASKAAIGNLAATLSVALAPQQVRVNVLAPGLIDTPLSDRLNERLAGLRGMSVAAIKDERISTIPVGRAGTPEEVAAACCFLLSQESTYCSGSTLYMTGGVMAGAT